MAWKRRRQEKEEQIGGVLKMAAEIQKRLAARGVLPRRTGFRHPFPSGTTAEEMGKAIGCPEEGV